LYVSDGCLTANGLYIDQLDAVPPTGHNSKGKPFWVGEGLKEALECLEKRYVPQGVRDLLRAFDALPPAEQHQAAVAILRRSAGSGEMPEEAYDELAADSFQAHDAEEAADANP
jgi:hypothetical protein